MGGENTTGVGIKRRGYIFRSDGAEVKGGGETIEKNFSKGLLGEGKRIGLSVRQEWKRKGLWLGCEMTAS